MCACVSCFISCFFSCFSCLTLKIYVHSLNILLYVANQLGMYNFKINDYVGYHKQIHLHYVLTYFRFSQSLRFSTNDDTCKTE